MDLEFAENEASDEAEEFYEDDEDSNDEANWRNDYPDEEEEDIDGEEDEDGYANQYGLDYLRGYGEEGDDNKLSEAMWKNCNLGKGSRIFGLLISLIEMIFVNSV